jgi:hypothetical protein
VEQVQRVGADLLGAELGWRAVKVPREAGAVVDLDLLGAGAVVAELEVVEQALA